MASDLAPVWKNRGQLLRRNNFELVIGAVARLLVCSPSAKLRDMTEAAALHVIVCDLYHQFGPQWFPRQILAMTPAALAPRHAMGNFGFTGLASVFRPVLPWVSGERILAVRVKKYRKFPALLDAKARTNPDVLQNTSVVKQAEEQ